MRLFKKLRRKLNYLGPEQVEEIYQAYLLAAEAHKNQKRFTGEPYITHPVAVASILADMNMDQQSIMSALMHDVLEDTELTKKAMAEQFGEEVAEIVDGVTKLSKIEFKTRAEAQAEYFRKMVLAMSRDIRVIIVKLADRLHNMRTLSSLPPVKRRRIAQETLDIFAPIANRLGMHEVSTELEDLGFASRYPKRYRALTDAVQAGRGHRREILSMIQNKIKEGLARANIHDCEVIGRAKHLYSIYKKMRDKQMPFSDVLDVYALRIIVTREDTCYRVLGVAHKLYKPIPERFKDYIAIPKVNGYQSLHTTLFGPYGIPLEIQIRTREMEERANSGVAAHWLYKTGEGDIDTSQIRAQQWVKNLLEMQQRSGNSLEFIENVKVDLFPDEVYVFSPKGKIFELPSGSTPVDFAYSIHTDLGNTCVAAKVDRLLSPLSTVLSNGQTIEIITSPLARPNPAWLDFVVTSKARASIRHFLKNQRRTESITLGKQLLNRSLKTRGLTIKKVPEDIKRAVIKEAELASFDDLLEDIGLGHRLAAVIAHRFSGLVSGNMASQIESVAGIIGDASAPLLIKGTEGMVINFADCCYPLPGDPIVALVDTGHGIVVHSEQCNAIAKIRHQPEKCMAVRWADDATGEYLTSLRVNMLNRKGVLATVSVAMSDLEANIDDIRIVERAGENFTVTFKLVVNSRLHLANVIRDLRKIPYIIRILRER